MYRKEVHGMWGRGSCHSTSPILGGLRGADTRAPGCQGKVAALRALAPVALLGWGLVSGVAPLPWPVRSQGGGEGTGRVVTASFLGW